MASEVSSSIVEQTDDEVELPPTQYLVMEVLAARYRLGEFSWPLPNAMKPALRALERRGWISFRHDAIVGHQRVWLEKEGQEAWLSPTYVPPRDVNDARSSP